jgi:hypothetical protein
MEKYFYFQQKIGQRFKAIKYNKNSEIEKIKVIVVDVRNEQKV